MKDNPKEIYAVSLGKSHFYLSKFIELDFGISLAIRMANEQSILLKKSRYLQELNVMKFPLMKILIKIVMILENQLSI
jgi:hypothetical protein